MKIIRRVLILWILGMVAQGNLLDFDLSKLYLFSNTLQAIAVGYLVASLALMYLPIFGSVRPDLHSSGGILVADDACAFTGLSRGHDGRATESRPVRG